MFGDRYYCCLSSYHSVSKRKHSEKHRNTNTRLCFSDNINIKFTIYLKPSLGTHPSENKCLQPKALFSADDFTASFHELYPCLQISQVCFPWFTSSPLLRRSSLRFVKVEFHCVLETCKRWSRGYLDTSCVAVYQILCVHLKVTWSIMRKRSFRIGIFQPLSLSP